MVQAVIIFIKTHGTQTLVICYGRIFRTYDTSIFTTLVLM